MNLRLQPEGANKDCLFCQAIVSASLLPGKIPCLSIYKTSGVQWSPTLEPLNPEPLNAERVERKTIAAWAIFGILETKANERVTI